MREGSCALGKAQAAGVCMPDEATVLLSFLWLISFTGFNQHNKVTRWRYKFAKLQVFDPVTCGVGD
jgi:hypothetical protein